MTPKAMKWRCWLWRHSWCYAGEMGYWDEKMNHRLRRFDLCVKCGMSRWSHKRF